MYLIANEFVELPPVCLTGKGNVYMNINITTVEYSMLRLYFKWITNKAGSNYVRYNSLGIVASALLVYIFDHLHLRYIRVIVLSAQFVLALTRLLFLGENLAKNVVIRNAEY